MPLSSLVGKSDLNFFDSIEKVRLLQAPSFWKTLYINYRCLDKQTAKQIPIFVYPNVSLVSTKGCISVKNPNIGIIKLGLDWGYRSKGETRFRFDGDIVFNGKARFMKGCNVCVFKGAKIIFGDDDLISENSLIYCKEKIEFGDHLRLTYECNVADSDFHYTIDLRTKRIKRMSAPIEIGNNVWIGNRTNIKKGTKIPDYVVIASSASLLTKDYTDSVSKFDCLGGIPAKPFHVSISRTWKNEHEQISRLDNWFNCNPNEKYYILSEKELIEDYIGTEYNYESE